MKDEYIVSELKQGNTRVLKECYKYLDTVKKFILKNSGTEEEAHDVFQDGLMIFYQNVLKGDFRLSSSVHTYLFAICRNVWYQKLRRKKVVFEYQANEQMETVHEDSAEEEQAKDLMIDEALALLDEMGDPCKTVLDLFYFRKVSLRSIAERLDYSSEDVAKQRKFRCIKELKQALQKRMDRLK